MSEEYKKFLIENDVKGCTDGGCIITPKGGMRTNGGCRCIENMHKVERNRLFHYMRKYCEKVEAEKDQIRLSALQECREIAETSISINQSKQDGAKEFTASQFTLEELYSHKATTGEAILREIQSLIDKENNSEK